MKKIIAALLFSVLSTNVFAGSGKAIVPHWYINGTYDQSFQIYISNTTEHTLDVSITVYKDDGTTRTATEEGQITNGTLAAGKSGWFAIASASAQEFGYAVIEWSNQGTDEDLVGLTAHAASTRLNTTTNFAYSVPINNGQPF